jgi:HAMP domain-containing protein
VSVSASTAAWIAIGACVAAALALGAVLYLWAKLRKLRDAQRLVLGGGQGDLVDFAVSLQARIDDLHRAVDEVAAGLSRVDRRVDGCVSKTSIVRYDAYEGAGGHQSASLAFLDAARSGVVFSAIQGRDYARIYVKELDHGRAPVALSPEEQEAVERAMSSSA